MAPAVQNEMTTVRATETAGTVPCVIRSITVPAPDAQSNAPVALRKGVRSGYATASTDDGTSGPPSGAPAFIDNEDVLLDYGYRAIKVTTEDSKAIIAALMGDNPRLSYFVGCSDGGREALKEAQRYPDDFDGIIVGSPVNDQIGEFGSSYLYDRR